MKSNSFVMFFHKKVGSFFGENGRFSKAKSLLGFSLTFKGKMRFHSYAFSQAQQGSTS